MVKNSHLGDHLNFSVPCFLQMNHDEPFICGCGNPIFSNYRMNHRDFRVLAHAWHRCLVGACLETKWSWMARLEHQSWSTSAWQVCQKWECRPSSQRIKYMYIHIINVYIYIYTYIHTEVFTYAYCSIHRLFFFRGSAIVIYGLVASALVYFVFSNLSTYILRIPKVIYYPRP